MQGKIFLDEKGSYVLKGNFSFLAEINEKLFLDFNEAEKAFKVNYRECIGKLRIAIETFTSIETEVNKYVFTREDSLFSRFEKILKYKGKRNCLVNECKKLVNEQIATKEENIIVRTCMEKLRKMGNMEHHSQVGDVKKIKYEEDEVYSYLVFMFNILKTYYNVRKKFKIDNMPIGDYIPATDLIYNSVLHVQKLASKRIYIKEEDGEIKYYLISTLQDPDDRDLAILKRIWDDNEKTEISKSIIKTENCIQGIKEKYYIFSLPGQPTSITSEVIEKLTNEEKKDIIKSLLEGMNILHNAKPPIYHRHISTDTFYLCKGKNGYVVKWVNFEYSKDYTAEPEKSVGLAWYDLFRKPQEMFLAPELRTGTRSIDLEKADIYSLGKFILFVMTGEILDYSKIKSAHMQKNVFQEKFKYILYMMLQYDPADRPSISEIIEVIKDWGEI